MAAGAMCGHVEAPEEVGQGSQGLTEQRAASWPAKDPSVRGPSHMEGEGLW